MSLKDLPEFEGLNILQVAGRLLHQYETATNVAERKKGIDRKGWLDDARHYRAACAFLNLLVEQSEAPTPGEGMEGLTATAIHANMLRGTLPKLTAAQIGHLYRGDEAREVITEIERQNPLDGETPDALHYYHISYEGTNKAGQRVVGHYTGGFSLPITNSGDVKMIQEWVAENTPEIDGSVIVSGWILLPNEAEYRASRLPSADEQGEG